jgi:triacylglycerol lipase
MIAWLTRMLLLAQAAIAFGVYLILTRKAGLDNAPFAALASIAFVFGVRLLIVLNNFMLAMHHHGPLPAHFRLDWPSRFALFFGETRATLTTSSWTMPFRRFRKRAAPQARGVPVLLIHGYGCNSGYWHAMSKALLAARITHHAVDMEPVFGSIDDYAPYIHAAVEELCRETGTERVVIVAHSMGGLATRAYLRDHGAARVAKVVTLGTPHHGTALAQFGIGINTREMHWVVNEEERPGSEWLRGLARAEDPEIYRLFVSIYSHHDNIIAPQTSSHLPGARNIELHGIGHVALALDLQVQALVVREVLASG